MFKVIGFELKKLVSRPGIYVLAVILAVLLSISGFIYSPTKQTVEYNKLDGETVTQSITDFNSNYKDSYAKIFSDSFNVAREVNENPNIKYQTEIKTLLNNFKQSALNYCDIANSVGSTDTVNNANLELMHNSSGTGTLDKLYAKVKELIGNTNNKYFKIAITNKNFANLDSIVIQLKSKVKATHSSKDYVVLANTLEAEMLKIENLINKIYYPNYANSVKKFTQEGNYYLVTAERSEIVLTKLSQMNSLATQDEDYNTNKNNILEVNNLFNEYRHIVNIYKTLLSSSLDIVLMDCVGIDNIKDIKFLENTNYYSTKELNAEFKYYIEHDTNESMYASPLSFDFTSNSEITGYDYSYFTMSIFGVILIMFAVMFASYSIAGETKDGTMRFVAIRPVNRTSIIMGKFLAICIMSLILLIFSGLISFIVGGVVFGINANNILTVINSSTVLVVHPMVSLIIYLCSIYLQLLVYISIAMMLTSFLKSDLFAFVLTVLFFIVNTMLPAFFGATSWLMFYPFTALNLYAFMGGSSIASNTILGKIFTPIVYSGGTLILSAIFIISFIVIFNTIAIFAFKKREL